MWRSSSLAVLPATATLSILTFLISPVKVAGLPETHARCGQLQTGSSQGLANLHITNTSFADVGAVEDVELPFCRLFGEISYGNNDSLGIQLWMPQADVWNKRFLAVGMQANIPYAVERADFQRQWRFCRRRRYRQYDRVLESRFCCSGR